MVKYMGLTKILNKEFWNEKKILYIVLAVLSIGVGISLFTGNSGVYDNSIREDVASARESVDRIEEFSLKSIDLITEIIDTNKRLEDQVQGLTEEGERARELTEQLRSDIAEYAIGLNDLADSALDNEFLADTIAQLLRQIERDNNYD